MSAATEVCRPDEPGCACGVRCSVFGSFGPRTAAWALAAGLRTPFSDRTLVGLLLRRIVYLIESY